jgi:hypothetical protein
VDAATAGLVGVALGGILTFLVEERRARNARRDQTSRDALAVRQALRLLDDEFSTALFACETTIDEGVWWDDGYYDVSTRQWERFQDVLAASDLSEKAWGELTLAASEVEALRHRRERSMRRDARPFKDDYALIVGAGQAFWDAIDAMRTYRGIGTLTKWDPPTWWKNTKEHPPIHPSGPPS